MRPQILDKVIRFHMNVDPEGLELTADPELIEQVLINLLLNAIQAVQDQPEFCGGVQLNAPTEGPTEPRIGRSITLHSSLRVLLDRPSAHLHAMLCHIPGP